MDHMRRGTLDLDGVKFVVLDEADEMLDMGFVEDIEFILEQVPDGAADRALLGDDAAARSRALAAPLPEGPGQRSRSRREQLTVPQIDADLLRGAGHAKLDVLGRILDLEDPELGDRLLPHQARGGRLGAGAAGARLLGRGDPRRHHPDAARPR